MFRYDSFQNANNKDADQSAWMCRLVCAFLVCKRRVFRAEANVIINYKLLSGGMPYQYLINGWIYSIGIYHECEGGIEKFVPRITDWHHKAWRGMKIGDHEGQIFLFHPHTNNGFFFLLSTKYCIYIVKTWKRLQKNPEYAEMRHGDVILTLQ